MLTRDVIFQLIICYFLYFHSKYGVYVLIRIATLKHSKEYPLSMFVSQKKK